jgi:hypothetical protein
MRTLRQEQIKELFYYDDGNLYWKIAKQGVAVGRKVGNGIKNKYLQVMVNRKGYLVHRLIATLHYGDFEGLVDHIDGDTRNNKIENLRIVTMEQNLWNAKRSKTNTTGIKGVSYIVSKQKYQATICIKGKNKNIGYFSSLTEAEQAIKKARQKLHGEFARHE